MESKRSTTQTLEGAVRQILSAFDDVEREGLQETPFRYIQFLNEFLTPTEFKFTTFEAEGYDQLILQDSIPFFSLCEHHLAPFFGEAAVAYIPEKRIVGLSKLARTVDHFARRLQNQERITTQVAEFLMNELQPRGVAVVIRAQHLCMSMRGIKKPNALTTTSQMCGVFRADAQARNEVLNLIHGKSK